MNTLSKLTIDHEIWPINGSFSISRGSRTEVNVLKITIEREGFKGVGECVPYARYGETIDSVRSQIEAISTEVSNGLSREDLQQRLPAGAARNGVDCAMWDMEAKRKGKTAACLAGIDTLNPVITALTISLSSAEKMKKDAMASAGRKLLKVKLGGDGDLERMIAVREGAPNARLILDANEAWRSQTIEQYMQAAFEIKADLVEQPLPADDDLSLSAFEHLVPVCADESLHTREGLSELRGRYECVNIKLDKAGGLSEALLLQKQARKQNFQIMVGCMVSTSLSMAPAMLLAQDAEFVDLDGPLLLIKDQPNGLVYQGSTLNPPVPALWG